MLKSFFFFIFFQKSPYFSGFSGLQNQQTLYLQAFDKTLGSHVTVYNAENYGNLYLNSIAEYINAKN